MKLNYFQSGRVVNGLDYFSGNNVENTFKSQNCLSRYCCLAIANGLVAYEDYMENSGLASFLDLVFLNCWSVKKGSQS